MWFGRSCEGRHSRALLVPLPRSRARERREVWWRGTRRALAVHRSGWLDSNAMIPPEHTPARACHCQCLLTLAGSRQNAMDGE